MQHSTETALPIPGVTDMRRLVGFVAMAGALALVLLGGLAVPAAAQTRQQAVRQANAAIDACFQSGGEPDAETGSGGDIAVGCTYEHSNDNYICSWQAGTGYKMNCYVTATGAGTHAPIGGGVLDGVRMAQDRTGKGGKR